MCKTSKQNNPYINSYEKQEYKRALENQPLIEKREVMTTCSSF